MLDDGNYSLEDKDISIKTGIEINDEKEYQELGTYTIPKPDTEEVSGNTSFTGYDYMKKFDTLYEDNNTYPKRLDDCLENLCQQVGLVLGSKDFSNNSYMIKGNPFTNGETRKTVLSNLVQLTGGFAEIDMEDGKLYVRNFDISGEPVETIDGNNYDEFKPNNVFGPVNSIRILMNSGVDGEETIKEAEGVTDENRCQITIADNYYLTSAEERELVINEIFNALNGLTYLPIELSYYGYPWLKLGQKIKVKDKNDNGFITYVMEHTLKYNGAYSGTIKATALTKTQQAYNEVISLKQWRRNTELAVDKINGEITQVVQTTETLEEELTNITTTEASATGKNIHIEDSAEEPLIDIAVKGETKQETRSGKNLFDINAEKETGRTTYKYSYNLKPNTQYTISSNCPVSTTANIYANSNSSSYGVNINKSVTITSDENGYFYIQVRFVASSDDNATFNLYEKIIDGTYYIQLEEGSEVTDYEPYGVSPSPDYPSEIENIDNVEINVRNGLEETDENYQSQTATFPLAEGQKLYEGSLLADDGIHNARKQIVYEGNDDEDWRIIGSRFYIANLEIVKESSNSEVTVMCNKLKGVSYGYLYSNNGTDYLISNCGTSGGSNRIFVSTNVEETGIKTVEDLKTWLALNPIIVEYELAEEEIIPYTEEQQEAWDRIKELYTYKNITNISSTADLDIVYVRDNGLSDMYATKKNYAEINEKLAQQKITTDAVTTTVSETTTKLNNDYLTAEQVNSKLEATDKDLEILQKKQTETETTANGFKVQIDSIINDGVSKVKTSMGYTFGDDGLIIDKEDAETGTIIDEASVRVIDKTGSEEQDLLYAGYVKEDNEDYPNYVGQTIVASTNMIVKNYLVVPNSRFEAYENPILGGTGTGAFEV